jgi:ABC-2 type transport system ATP-binding protein
MGTDKEQPVVAVTDLTRRFGRKAALDGVSLTVHQGRVFGLVGENGAGKTTLIKHLLGALTAESGAVRVFGVDPTWDPVAVLSRIGYLSEDRDLPRWMRLNELMRYTRAFFPDWDQAYAERLCEQFSLPGNARIRQLSRGEQARAGLLVALAHRPDLLLLDEPSSGLDTVARRDILAAVVRSVAEEGRTVVFSSHLLEEVERVADDIFMIHEGKCVLDMSMDDLKASHHRFVVRFGVEQASFPNIPGVIRAEGEGLEWNVVCQGDIEALRGAVAEVQGRVVEETIPSLDTVFVAHVTGRKNAHAVA